MKSGNNATNSRSGASRKRPLKNALTKEILEQFQNECAHCKDDNGNDDLESEVYQNERETQSFQAQALHIQQPGPEFDPNVQPQDGNEYLTHMMYERERCPLVIQRLPKNLTTNSSDILSNGIFSADQDLPSSDNLSYNLRPTQEWINEQCRQFMQARIYITRLRFNSLHEACADEQTVQPPMPADEEEVWQLFCREHAPRLSIMQNIRQRQLELLLDWLSEWLQSSSDTAGTITAADADLTDSVNVGTHSNTPPDLGGSERWLGMWIYATLASLQMPLEPHVHSALREIARSCLILRSRLEAHDEKNAIPYNLFLAIIVECFRQLDFENYI